MKTLTILAAAAALALSGCASGPSVKELTTLVKAVQDDKNCDRVEDIDTGAEGGQLGGGAHASYKLHKQCFHTGGPKPAAVVAPPTSADPANPPA